MSFHVVAVDAMTAKKCTKKCAKLLLSILRNGSDKNDSNNGKEHVGMQKSC